MEVPEVNCPHIDISKEVEDKEEIPINELKENQTISLADEKRNPNIK